MKISFEWKPDARNFTERIARELFRNRALANRIFFIFPFFLPSPPTPFQACRVAERWRFTGRKKNSSLHFSFEFSPERSSLTRRRHGRRENLTECEFPIRDTIRHFPEIRNESVLSAFVRERTKRIVKNRGIVEVVGIGRFVGIYF